ncbi:MAG TPA: ATP-dependent helicase HrpB [bacterium]|nr:ATP-dependent helicase HrpB [bacterium]
MNPTLPIDSLIPDLLAALEGKNTAVITAEPGAGKTTRVPPALLGAPFAGGKEIWVLQPRRLAAKMAALRVAEELGPEAGKAVGYQFRFENKTGPQTRLKFMTDGMLLPLAQADPGLAKVAAVVLDEFHERSLALELGLAWLRRLQLEKRPDLRLLVMSATLDAGALSEYLGGAPIFASKGRIFPVGLEYLPQPEHQDLSLKVKGALRRLNHQGVTGTTLVFLPGLGEIRRCQGALKDFGEVHALYGDLPVEEQQAVLKPTPGRKVILSTNVAETSLTVPGVTSVIDSGLTRQSRVSGWSGLPSLVTVPASQASAAQRTGRAGRLQEGFCVRLYSKFDYEHRAAFDLPELLRSDLSKSLLDLKKLGVEDLEQFPWFLKPSESALATALGLLKRLGALDPQNRLTETGRRMASFPLAPRLSKLLLEAQASAEPPVARLACRLAALISEERAGGEDLLEELKKYQPGFESKRLEEQLAGLLGLGNQSPAGRPNDKVEEALAKCLLAAFPDRVGKLRAGDPAANRHPSGKKELVLSSGGSAQVSDSPLTRAHDYFVVVEAQETQQGGKTLVKARSLAPLSADWLLDLFMDEIKEEQAVEWDGKAQRVNVSQRLLYGQLVLDEKVLPPSAFGPEARALLVKEALAAGPQAYADPDELSQFLNRVAFAAQHTGDLRAFTPEQVEETLRDLSEGCRSLSDLKQAGLVEALKARLSPSGRSLLEKLAPGFITLAGGRRAPIYYEAGKPPWAESRIQDFFGMKQGPALANGKVPVVLHLLTPGKKPVQITSDLAGFWERHYPQARKELSRRYPRHQWPERPI